VPKASTTVIASPNVGAARSPMPRNSAHCPSSRQVVSSRRRNLGVAAEMRAPSEPMAMPYTATAMAI
jgi:hypothetical protein